MTTKNQLTDPANDQQHKNKKRVYQTPRIVDSSAFERLALACNGTASQRGAGVKGAPSPNDCTSVAGS